MSNSVCVLLLLCFVLGTIHATTSTPEPSRDPALEIYAHAPPLDRTRLESASDWVESATASLQQKLSLELNRSKAKNVILFLGDGMSMSTVTAARIYKGQMEGLRFGEEGQLHMDSFPFVGTSKTYCADFQTADSACSSTAYLCGSKANVKTIGVTPTVRLDNCTLQMDPVNQVSSILAWAQAAGKSTGIVTTTTVTHASPAGAYAHIANRDWENNKKVEASGVDSDTCDDIAEQLVLQEPGRSINVVLGGGRTHFLDESVRDSESTNRGSRNDRKNLIQDWLDHKMNDKDAIAEFVTGREELMAVDTNQTEFLLGLFADGHVTYADEQVANDDPTLAEMTQVAVEILSRNPKGFFLFVEGGRIDHAHHDNQGRRALAETLQFDEAIELTDSLTSDDDTLIVVTADHSHAFTMAGYSWRGNSILGFSNGGLDAETSDGLPYTTLSYINGNVGYRKPEIVRRRCYRADTSDDSIYGYKYSQVASVPMKKTATHAGEDVLILAKGPWAHLFSGVNEQSFIPHAMAYAACISPTGLNSCDSKGDGGNRSAAVIWNRSDPGLGLLFVLPVLHAILRP